MKAIQERKPSLAQRGVSVVASAALAFSMVPACGIAWAAEGDGDDASAYQLKMSEGKVIGNDGMMDSTAEDNIFYYNVDGSYDTVEFSDFAEDDEVNVFDFKTAGTGYYDSECTAPVAASCSVTWSDLETVADNTYRDVSFDEGAADLDYTNAYAYEVMDEDYDVYTFIVNFNDITSFEATADNGNTLTNRVMTKDGYTYTDYYGTKTTVDLYTVYVPANTDMVDIAFPMNVLAYNYDVDGTTYIAGYYEDYMTGADTATVEIDADHNGVSDIIQVQTPYDSSYNSTLLYAITFQPIDFSIPTLEDAAMSVVTGGYTYTSWDGAETTVDLYKVYVDDLSAVSTFKLQLSNPGLAYNYDVDGATYLWGATADYMTGATEFEAVPVDYNKDGVSDITQIQTPYFDGWTSDLLYAIQIVETPAYDELLNNLMPRFIEGGSDDAISNMTVDAAIAANALGYGNYLNPDAIVASLESAEKGSSFSAGTLAKYALALSYAGVDCTCVRVNGEQRNLINEIAEGAAALDQWKSGVYSYVYLLPLFTQFNYEIPQGCMTVEEMAAAIVSEQGENGLFGYAGYEDTQTTAQAMLALANYDDEEYADAIDKAGEALRDCQTADGGFGYNYGDTTSNLTATGAVLAALVGAQGDSGENMVSSEGNTPMDYLMAMADDDLSGFTKSESGNEPLAAACAALGLAAQYNENYSGTADAFYAPISVMGNTIAGETRYETAAKIVDEELLQSEEGSYEGVIIASGEGYADALSASGLAGVLDYPVLLCKPGSIEAETKAALESLVEANGGKLDVIVVGGTAAISADVANQLAAYDTDGAINRLAGETRYETSEKILEYGAKQGDGWQGTAIVTTGGNFADALAASPYAACYNAPVVLVSDTVSATAQSTIKSCGSAVVLGGDAAVSNSVYATVSGLVGSSNIKRLSGSTRYETGLNVAAWEIEQGMDPETTAYATGKNYPDALACGFMVGSQNGILILVDPDGNSNQAIYDFASDSVAGQAMNLYLLGGTGAVSQNIRFSLLRASTRVTRG